jgi:hypothetical protein
MTPLHPRRLPVFQQQSSRQEPLVSSLSSRRPLALFFAIMLGSSLGGSACVDRVHEQRDYGPCSNDDDCRDGASCFVVPAGEVCSPPCNEDSDCPEVDAFLTACVLGSDGSKRCLLGSCPDCPDGMVCAVVNESPTSGVICVWR